MLKSVIENVHALEIFDSRGNPTVEVFVTLSNGVVGKAEVPSGASTGENEAVELRDGGSRLGGKGVMNAVNNVNTEINDALKGLDPHDQPNIDATMIALDGTKQGSSWCYLTILGVSMATAHCATEITTNHCTVTLVVLTLKCLKLSTTLLTVVNTQTTVSIFKNS